MRSKSDNIPPPPKLYLCLLALLSVMSVATLTGQRGPSSHSVVLAHVTVVDIHTGQLA